MTNLDGGLRDVAVVHKDRDGSRQQPIITRILNLCLRKPSPVNNQLVDGTGQRRT